MELGRWHVFFILLVPLVAIAYIAALMLLPQLLIDAEGDSVRVNFPGTSMIVSACILISLWLSSPVASWVEGRRKKLPEL